MSEDKIISLVLSRLNQEDMWFTTKADPTWEEPSDYYKLDEYGDLTEASVKKIVKEVENLIGDGAVDIDDAVEVWLQDAMVDYKIAYKNILVTKFKDKPVVAGLEAYKNPVQLSENKTIKKDKYPTPTGDIVEYKLSNKGDNPIWITGYVSTDENIYDVSGKVFMTGSEFGIDNGPISKLHIRLKDTNEVICNYDRGWDIKPDNKYKNDVEAIMKLLVDFRDKNPYEVEESYKKVNEGYKRRLKEENNKSANLISDMFKASDFDAESKQGQIVMRTSELFNALSDKGYDVQVNFDNGESTSAVLLGQQGGQVIITINNTDQPLRAFTSGNFEINNDNMNVLKDIQEQISAL